MLEHLFLLAEFKPVLELLIESSFQKCEKPFLFPPILFPYFAAQPGS
jgi:hypothetical protein